VSISKLTGVSAILTAAAGVRDDAGAVELSTKILWRRCLVLFHKLSIKHSISQNHYVLLFKKLFAFLEPYIFVPLKLFT